MFLPQWQMVDPYSDPMRIEVYRMSVAGSYFVRRGHFGATRVQGVASIDHRAQT